MDEFAYIAETYDWTERSTDDIPFFVRLARQAAGPILEMGAGTGRVTIPVAKAGKPVTALDVSPSMLARGRAKWEAENASGNVRFLVGDFRNLCLAERFGLILAPARVFEHAMSDAERASAFRGCAQHLALGGRLALYVWGPPPDTDPSPPAKSKRIEATTEHGALQFTWREERDFDTETRTHHFTVEELDGQRRQWQHPPIRLRWYTAGALDALGEAAGLKTEGRFRDFERETFEEQSVHMVWVYSRQ